MVPRRKVSTRPPQDRDLQLLDGFKNVLAVALSIRDRRVFLKDTSFNAPSQMLNEIPINQWVDLPDGSFRINLDSRCRRFLLPEGETCHQTKNRQPTYARRK